jgi:hypothetical protein
LAVRDCLLNIFAVVFFGVMKSRKIRLAGHVACMGERRDVYNILVGKPEGKGPLGRPRRRWENNISGGMDWIELAQDRDWWHL